MHRRAVAARWCTRTSECKEYLASQVRDINLAPHIVGDSATAMGPTADGQLWSDFNRKQTYGGESMTPSSLRENAGDTGVFNRFPSLCVPTLRTGPRSRSRA